MDKIYRIARSWPGRLALVLPALFLWFATAAMAQAQNEDPPGRVANLSWRDGGVVFAPAGEEEWADLPVNRPLTRGDRLWTDRGARAELHLGSATMHLNGESHIGITELDDEAAQLILQQGTLNARVREIDSGENFEIDTPNLALRAEQPGNYRVDVSPDGVTRVTVHSGQATVYGDGGRSLRMGAGQEFSFGGRELAQVADPFGGRDGFDQWAAERNRGEDQSVAARHIPRSVIGYSQLDAHGSWDTVPEYGAVWYPRVTVADWAPYRHGRWSWIQPWGWTWVDDAPWGFAPFHYGRWARIGPRWAWVPGRFERRPAYAPALVVFLGGGGSGWSFNVGSSPGVGWYPLAPGEAWRPSYRTSSLYLTRINRDWRYRDDHLYRRYAGALTAVPIDAFRYGRPVRSHWRSVNPATIAQAPANWTPVRPVREREMWRGERPRLQAQPPAQLAGVQQNWPGRRGVVRSDDARGLQERAQRESQRQQQGQASRGIQERQQQIDRQQEQARQQLERAQREAAQRQQQEQSVRAMQERQQERQQQAQQQAQQERQQQAQQARQVQERAQRQEQEQRLRQQQQQQHEQAVRAQQRQQHEQQLRQQQERAQREAAQREAAQRQLHQQQEQARQQQERAQREAAAQRQQQRVVPASQPQAVEGRGQGQGQGRGQRREDEEDQRNRGRGQGSGRNG